MQGLSQAVVAAGLMAVGVAGGQAFGAVIAADTFTLTPSRTSGSQLNTTTTEVGGETWNAAGNVVFQTGGNTPGGAIGVNSPNDSSNPFFGNGLASVPYSTALGQISEVQIEAKPISANSDNWIGLGFGVTSNFVNDNIGYFQTQYANPFALLTGGGSVGLPNATSVTTGIYTFNSGGFNLFDLTYDPTTKIEVVTINGSVALTGTLGTLTAPLTTAGFAFYQQNDTGSATPAAVDDFVVSNSPLAVVPEPASLGLLAAGGLMLLRRKR